MHALTTQDVCFDILFDDECSEVFGLEKLLGHLLHLLGCDVIYALEELMNVFFPTVVEETFASRWQIARDCRLRCPTGLSVGAWRLAIVGQEVGVASIGRARGAPIAGNA